MAQVIVALYVIGPNGPEPLAWISNPREMSVLETEGKEALVGFAVSAEVGKRLAEEMRREVRP